MSSAVRSIVFSWAHCSIRPLRVHFTAGQLTNNAAVVTSTGSTAAAIVADLASLIAAIQAPAGDRLMWIMRPLTAATISARLAGAGYPTTPGFLLGLPVITASSSPAQITLLDGDAVVFSSDDSLSFDVSTNADVEMADTGLTQDGTTGTGVVMTSLYQNSLVGVRACLKVSWQPAYIGAGSPTVNAGISYMTVTF